MVETGFHSNVYLLNKNSRPISLKIKLKSEATTIRMNKKSPTDLHSLNIQVQKFSNMISLKYVTSALQLFGIKHAALSYTINDL